MFGQIRNAAYWAYFSGVVIGIIGLSAAATAQPERYLGDMPEAFSSKQAWGALGRNTAAFAPNGPAPLRLRIADKEYDRGLGHHASGEIVVPLSGKYIAFKADIGVQWQGGGRGSVAFEVWVDGEKRFAQDRMSDSDPAQSIEVSVAGAQTLKLVALDAGDNFSCDMANWADARLVRDISVPEIGRVAYGVQDETFDGKPGMEGSFALIGHSAGSQIAFSRPLNGCAVAVKSGETVQLTIPVSEIGGAFTVSAEAVLAEGSPTEAWLALESGAETRTKLEKEKVRLTLSGDTSRANDVIILGASGAGGDAAVCWTHVQFVSGARTLDIGLCPPAVSGPPVPDVPDVELHPILEKVLVEWDWRMQDGIGAGAVPGAFGAAIADMVPRGNALIADLQAEGKLLPQQALQWRQLCAAWEELRAAKVPESDARWENLWLQLHNVRRWAALASTVEKFGPLLFVKQAPGMFSHQLTQYYGRYARPGGGVFVLDRPGESMALRPLGRESFPSGSFMQPEVTQDGQRVLVAFCPVDAAPKDTFKGEKGRFYHLYEINADGSGVHPLTAGAYDDFAPKELPDGHILFISTRRGGWHRCGTPGCEVYTLTRMNREGGDIRTISFHETQEWDPSVLNDGRVIYTRWDYVDRNAVHYQQLWTARPDGSSPVAFYGNNTLNPVGVWEARAVPGSQRIMATAAAHHAMTAGSIILVDVEKGVDGLEPITRLTPDVPFPESESPLAPSWRAALAPEPPARTPGMDRWPGQCYRSAYPLSEKVFLAAYSFDTLIGEPKNNVANMFGLYLVDAFGNKELLYRDLNISSLWPIPLRTRMAPPTVAPVVNDKAAQEGAYLVRNVYESNPGLEAGSVKWLRIVQVLPKSTSGANNPPVGLPNASPGKQVLGVVPVEPDGSAYFQAPADIPLAFQALDELGQAVQVMRSVVYLQRGERVSCIGCHEPRISAPSSKGTPPLASLREPSAITAAPDGSKPLSYPLLVQPVLDKYCVSCHSGEKPAGPDGKAIVLTGAPEGKYTASYNALAPRVSFSSWGRGTFPDGNCEPMSKPGFFGAKGSALAKMLQEGHHDVKLDRQDWDRMVTWMDANALFYGTFEFTDQDRQQRGERIAGPGLE